MINRITTSIVFTIITTLVMFGAITTITQRSAYVQIPIVSLLQEEHYYSCIEQFEDNCTLV
jgi:hypothetical protein